MRRMEHIQVHENSNNILNLIKLMVSKCKLMSYMGFSYIVGFPVIGVEWQKMENPDLRQSVGMAHNQKGVRIRRVEPTAPESNVLKPSDVILSFDGVDIANDGTGEH